MHKKRKSLIVGVVLMHLLLHPDYVGGAPTGHGPATVERVLAIDTNTSAGDRRSSERLQMVRDPSTRTADLVASFGGRERGDNEPTWSGLGVEGNPGESQAKFVGSDSTSATATMKSGQAASVTIELFDVDRNTKDFGVNERYNLFTDSLSSWGNDIGITIDQTFQGDMKVESWHADKWDDPSIGRSRILRGTQSAAFTASGSRTDPFHLFGWTAFELTSTASASLEVEATSRSYRHDVDKEPGTQTSGEVTFTLSGTLTFTIDQTIHPGVFGVDQVIFSGSVEVGPEISSTFNTDSGDLTITVNQANVVGRVGYEVFFESGQTSEGEASFSPDWIEPSFSAVVPFGDAIAPDP